MNRVRTYIFALLIAFLAGCSKFVSSTASHNNEYHFPGATALTPNTDGTYTLAWPTPPTNLPIVYSVFMKQGTAANPDASSIAFDFAAPLAEIKTKETTLVTPYLLFNYNTCFMVRLVVEGFNDTNQTVICSGHERFVFGGIASLGVQQGGSFNLAWPKVPDADVSYSLYTRRSNLNESYNFSATPLMVTSVTLATTKAFPLDETRCFLVRFSSKNSNTDANTKEVCSNEDGVADFKGIASATSIIW